MANDTNTSRRLVTIVTEAGIEATLLADLERLGAHGYTVTEARGKGSHGVRSGSWGPSANIRVETVCDRPTAEAITRYIRDAYLKNYAITLFTHDVEVLQPDKF